MQGKRSGFHLVRLSCPKGVCCPTINRVIHFRRSCGKIRDMRTPDLTNVAWLGPRIEMDDASHFFGKCSECHEIICVEKVVTDSESTQTETNEMLYKVFHAHVALKHSHNINQSAA